MSINLAVFSGNLTREPSVGATKSGLEAIGFCVAVNDRRKNPAGEWEDYANFIEVTAYGKPWLADKLAKGAYVLVEGSLRYYPWQDKETGKNRSKLDVVAKRVELLRPTNQPAQDQPAVADYDLPF